MPQDGPKMTANHRTFSLQNLANTDTKSTLSVSQANFVQHKLEDAQDSPQDLQHGSKMVSKSTQNRRRDTNWGLQNSKIAPKISNMAPEWSPRAPKIASETQLGPSNLQDSPQDCQHGPKMVSKSTQNHFRDP